jgi:phage tail-like protein
MRYWVDVTGVDGIDRLNTQVSNGTPQAGFSAVTTPEATVEAVEYKEGQWVYTRKYPGNPSMGDITMSRGVARGDSSFWEWMKAVIEGGEYRADLDIKHFHRDQQLLGQAAGTGNIETSNVDNNPARAYQVKQAFPIRHKVAADLDATASEISIMEIDCAYENFDVIEYSAPT